MNENYRKMRDQIEGTIRGLNNNLKVQILKLMKLKKKTLGKIVKFLNY